MKTTCNSYTETEKVGIIRLASGGFFTPLYILYTDSAPVIYDYDWLAQSHP